MNASLELTFAPGGGLLLNTSSRVEGMRAVVQNALVNLLTDLSSDPVFPRKGTELMRQAFSGQIFDSRSAEHSASFAASDTLFFGREHDVAEAKDKIKEIFLVPKFPEALKLNLEATFVSIDDRRLSFPIPLSQ